MTEQNNLKMYVWEHVLKRYTYGLMVALAHNVEEARSLLKREIFAAWGEESWMLEEDEEEEFSEGGRYGELLKEPDVYEIPTAVFVEGGD